MSPNPKEKERHESLPPSQSANTSRASSPRSPLGDKKLIMQRWGENDPASIDDYLARDGYSALRFAVKEMKPFEVIEEVAKVRLRGRGGAGFPVAEKWEIAAAVAKAPKVIIANAYGADPSAAGDRALLERNPHQLIEGLAIAAYAVGAERGYIYCRSNLAQALGRLQQALQQAKERGLVGEGVFGTHGFTISIVPAPVAFVNGEETALLAVIEGTRPMPRQRPPYPAEIGLWGLPTVINNAETLANLPPLIRDRGKEFGAVGSEKTKGTKLLTLQGRLASNGLVEVPFGMTLRRVIDSVAGGTRQGATLKAVQVGGPIGGCLPVDLLDTPLDYETLAEVGATVGSGSLLALDRETCMVDFARFRLTYLQNEACGRCIPGRLGTNRINGILEAIVSGLGKKGDLELLEELAAGVRESSLCGLCALATQPLLTTLKYFRDDYVAHVEEKRCPTGKCTPVRTEAFRRNKVL